MTDEAPPSTLADRLRTARLEAGMSQRRLAWEAQVNPRHVRRLESGERHSPSDEVLARIADALGVTVAELRPDPLAGAGSDDEPGAQPATSPGP